MTKTKRLLTLIALLTLPYSVMNAQNRKLFTLEDLNFGGKNYRNLLPENKWYEWWGDQLMYLDAEEGGTVDVKGNQQTLYKLEEVGSEFHSAYSAQYPYPTEPLVLLTNNKQRVLFNWKTKQIAWSQSCEGETSSDWNSQSRAVAFVKNSQLFVRTADNQERQLTTDGSREIVYGQSVHRNEFGIQKGTFWSPDGQRLAFYRMDQSMVSDYPQVDIFPRVAEYQPDKYPMAGMTSHKVTVGV